MAVGAPYSSAAPIELPGFLDADSIGEWLGRVGETLTAPTAYRVTLIVSTSVVVPRTRGVVRSVLTVPTPAITPLTLKL
jgi:hypothetical protein